MLAQCRYPLPPVSYEPLIRNQQAGGSSPLAGTNKINGLYLVKNY